MLEMVEPGYPRLASPSPSVATASSAAAEEEEMEAGAEFAEQESQKCSSLQRSSLQKHVYREL